jgi:hypothetical protein
MEVSRGRAGMGFLAGSCPLQVRRGYFSVRPRGNQKHHLKKQKPLWEQPNQGPTGYHVLPILDLFPQDISELDLAAIRQ